MHNNGPSLPACFCVRTVRLNAPSPPRRVDVRECPKSSPVGINGDYLSTNNLNDIIGGFVQPSAGRTDGRTAEHLCTGNAALTVLKVVERLPLLVCFLQKTFA